MSATVKPAPDRFAVSDGHSKQASRTILAAGGALLSIVGALLAVGGYVSPLSGSAFYMFAGAALIVSGILMAKRHRAGAWTYMAVFAGSLAWSLRGIDGGSSLAFRLVGPVALLAVLAVLMPVLCNWRPRHAAMAFLGLTLATIGVATASSAYQSQGVCLPASACNSATQVEHHSDSLESNPHARAY